MTCRYCDSTYIVLTLIIMTSISFFTAVRHFHFIAVADPVQRDSLWHNVLALEVMLIPSLRRDLCHHMN
jgi:hypothetical protein